MFSPVALGNHKPIDTIRLSDREKRQLINHVDQSHHQSVEKERRGLRLPFHATDTVVAVTHPTGSETQHAVLPRNLSRQGMSFVVGRFIYPDSQATVYLSTIDGEDCSLNGRIVRCVHFEGIIHECGIVFDEPVDMGLFVTLTEEQAGCLLQQTFSESRGTVTTGLDHISPPIVLVIDPLKTDRRLFGLWLEKLGFKAIEADSLERASKVLAIEEVELVLLDQRISEMEDTNAVAWLRTENYRGPIVTTYDDGDDQTVTKEANEQLAKPFDQEDLEMVIEKLLSMPGEQEAEQSPIYSKLADDEQMCPLLREFVVGLGETVQALRRASGVNDIDTITSLCRQLKGVGNGYGFPQITALAALVLEETRSEQETAEGLHQCVSELVNILRCVRAE